MKHQLNRWLTASLAILVLVGFGAFVVSQRANAAGDGKITGTVKLDGAAPHMRGIDMSKDPFCDKAHAANPAHSENVVVGNGGHVAPPDSARPMRVLIVLSAPMSFAPGEDLHPIKAAKDLNQRIFYIRYRPALVRRFPPPDVDPFGRQRNMGRGLPRLPVNEVQQDSLEGTLKPLDPRLFDVDSPEQFRKALAAILGEISRM